MNEYNKDKPESIQAMFGSIAKRYDKANAILSLRMHKWWNAELVRRVTEGKRPEAILDLCCGTGDIAYAYLQTSESKKNAILVDFCHEMLECAKHKAQTKKLDKHQISYIQADVQKLPLPDSLMPCATMAYGIRNVRDPQQCFQEVYRVLKPGGIFGILELTQPSNAFMRIGHFLYLRTALPLIGKLVTTNKEAYQYLCKSIRAFIPPRQLEEMLANAGFHNTYSKPLTCGIATIIIGHK